jgi:putative transferase (TIGR04331 family)
MKISAKNIRATPLEEFWVDEYPDTLYLWQGSKNNDTLEGINRNNVPTLSDLFLTQKEIQSGHEFCKNYYYRILPELASRLNRVHGLDLPASFWQIVFGYWLYRHVSIVYDKYVYLSSLDIDTTSLKLLNESNYYTPQNHIDYIFCFAGDFGVQQLVSQYYYLFKTKEFETVDKKYVPGEAGAAGNSILLRFNRKISTFKGEPTIALLGVYFNEKIVDLLGVKSEGQIANINLPEFETTSNGVDFAKRECMTLGFSDHPFDSYFAKSLYHCLPMDFLENFLGYYDSFRRDIKTRKFTHIISEEWISNIPVAIYVALAKNDKRTFIAHEHGAGSCYYENCLQFVDYDAADIYLSVGWRGVVRNLVQGGFTCRDIVPYKFCPEMNTILFVTRTKFIYWEEFNEYNATNSTFIKELGVVANFIRLLSPILKANVLFRPRPAKLFWDVENLLELKQCNIRIDRGNFAESITQSRIVVIDHLSTGFAEILLMGVPFMLVYDIRSLPLPSELREIFDDLISCGVVHLSAESAVSKLSSVYDNVGGWWQSESVRNSVRRLTEVSLSPASRTTDYLLSLLSGDSGSRLNLQYRFWRWVEDCLRQSYRLVREVRSLVSPRAK